MPTLPLPFATIAAIALLVLGLGYLLWLALAGEGSVARGIRTNLQRGLESGVQGRAGRTARREGTGRRLLGTGTERYLERLVVRAGRPEAWPVERVVAFKLLGGGAAILLGALVVVRAGTPQSLALAIFLFAFAFFLPDLLLYNTGIKRREAIELELPDTLDQMSIAVEAGLGFDAALVRVARNGTGVLSGELIRTLQDIQVGQPRRVAYEALAARTSVPSLRRFIRAVIRAEEYGIPRADVLFAQAREMRIARRQRAERTAMEIPVKVVFPLILCLLPALMIVIIGPAGLSIMEAFSG